MPVRLARFRRTNGAQHARTASDNPCNARALLNVSRAVLNGGQAPRLRSAIALIWVLFVICVTWSTRVMAAELEFDMKEDQQSKMRTFQLTFYDKFGVVAKRIFQEGKLILSEGEIPRIIVNATTVELVAQEDTGPSNQNRELIYSQRGKILARVIYKDGQAISEGSVPDGLIIEYYEDKKIKNIYVNKHGTRNGPALGLYNNGGVKAEAYYEDGYPTGMGRRYYENGNLMAEWNLVNGKETFHREYYENGKPKEEVYYEGGKSKRKVYDPDGKLMMNGDALK